MARELTSNRTLFLDDAQRRLFQTELTAVRRRRPGRAVRARIVPDCEIVVRRGSQTTTYDLYSRVVLRERGTSRIWQFYFGMLLLEWLDAV
jgi:hypothetical protein